MTDLRNDQMPCPHPNASLSFHERGEFQLTACALCSRWWDEKFPENTKPLPLPPIVRKRKEKPKDPPALKTNAKSLTAVAELRERYQAAGGKGRTEIRQMLSDDVELTATEMMAVVKAEAVMTESDRELLGLIFDLIDGAKL